MSSRLWLMLVFLLCTGPAAAQIQAMQPEPLARLKAQENRRVEAAERHLNSMRNNLGLDSAHQFYRQRSHTDRFGQTHARFQQQYQGLKVWGGEAIVHLDESGYSLPVTDALKRNIQVNITPRITAEQAIDIANKDFQVIQPLASPLTANAELLIYPQTQRLLAERAAPRNAADVRDHVARYRLAYHVQARFLADQDEAHYSYLIDAQSGAILKQWNDLHTAASVGRGYSEYSGSVGINTDSTATSYELRDTTRGVNGRYGNNVVINLDHQRSGDGSIFTDADNSWGDGKDYVGGAATASANGQTAAVDAAYGLQGTWDYFRNIHQRNGVDNKGTATYSRVHYGTNYANAFWDNTCFCMTYGDGNGGLSFSTVTALDVVGHELTHGVTAATADLVYSEESGGLNEANSDIHGTMVEFYMRGANGSGNSVPDSGGNWTHGEQFTPGGMRYMYKPSLDGKSFDAWSEELQKVDVHYSSGPMNRAFYFLSQGAAADSHSQYYSPYLAAGMAGIGNDKAIRIWYRAVTAYMTSTSNYLAARFASLKAAIDLYGSNSAEHIAVRKAFGAINVGLPDDTSDDFEAPTIAVNSTVTQGVVALSASASDNRGVVRVDYYVSAVYVGSATTAPFTLNVDATQFSNGAHLFFGKAYDAAGNSATSASGSFTLDNATQQLLRDPGFEGNSGTWFGNGPLLRDTDTNIPVHGGHYFAAFGGMMIGNKLVPQMLFQQVAIPDDTPYVNLSFWLRISSSELTALKDTLKIQIRSATPNGVTEGNLIETLATYSNLDKRNDYLQKTFDLSAYRGQSIQIYLLAEIIDLADTASFMVDDFSLSASRTRPVLVNLAPASKTMLVNGQQRFTATLSGSQDTRVSWSVVEGAKGGSIDADGNYTAPATLGDYHVRAASLADPRATAQASLKVTAADGSRIALLPYTVTVPAGGTQLFTAALTDTLDPRVWWSIVWTAEGSGVVNTRTGLYTAPLHPGNYVIRANSISDDIYADAHVRVVDPVVPTGLAATAVSATQVLLSWTAPFNADAHTVYQIYRNGALLTTVQNATEFIDGSLSPIANYSYAVAACDAAANCSTQSSTATTQTNPASFTINIMAGWNLLGNSSTSAWDVAARFGPLNAVISVWKWLPAKTTWAFYSPNMTDHGRAYASSKGYDFLTAIDGGEGFWVNASSSFNFPADFAVVTVASDFRKRASKALAAPWNLLAVGGYGLPSEFNQTLSASSPATATDPVSLTSFWAWDNAQMKWVFYAPALENSGELSSYAQANGYLLFDGRDGRLLAPGKGFWVHVP